MTSPNSIVGTDDDQFTVGLLSGVRFEVDFSDALVSREGVAVFIGPAGVPVLFDHQSVSQLIAERNTAA